MKACKKLKTTGFRSPVSDLSSEYEVVFQRKETLDQLSLGNENKELIGEVNTNASSSNPIPRDYAIFGQTTVTPEQLPPHNTNDELKEEVNTKTSSLDSINYEFEVFLSFKSTDTRSNFVSHLYKELKKIGIQTFMDDKKLERGKSLSFLLEVIERSKIMVVVFSPNYASSIWCLDELVKMVECRKSKNQVILPIFYNLDLDQETEFYSKALEDHQKMFENDKIKKWRSALSTVVSIAGWDSRKCGNDATLIECVVGDVLDRLRCKSSSLETCLVGIDSHITNFSKKLGLECDDIRLIGIWGPGGVGKTTIADFIYHKECSNYDACCRIKNIKDKFEKEGANALQKELISQILLEKDLDFWDEDVGCDIIRKRLQHKKVFIILDDVNELRQLEVLANDVQWFGQGSRIIVTTRNKRLLVEHGIKYIYEVSYLNKDKALQLFSLHAFRKNQPSNDFLELSKKFVCYTKGLPLALKILGRCLYERDAHFWHGELEKLKKFPNEDIYRTLKISYDELEENVKDVFLDIAFFFDGATTTTAHNVLHQCGFHPQNVFLILEEKALLTISNNRLEMHDLIKAMGHKIVKEEARDPSNRTRVCDPDDVYEVLTNCREESFIEGISLNMSELHKSINVKPNRFKRMHHLRVLNFFVSDYRISQRIHLSEGLDYLPNQLRYFRWDYFSLKSLPFASFGENLVELSLENSNIRHLWDGEVELANLRVINLSGSKLKSFPSLTKMPRIEEIILRRCNSFNGFCSDLMHLNTLKVLNLEGCRKLDELPVLPLSLVELNLRNSSIKELPLGFQFLKKLEVLNLAYCKALKAVPTEFDKLESLSELSIMGAAVEELPTSFSKLKLKNLYLVDVSIRRLPENIGEMTCLIELRLERIPITVLPESVGELQSLEFLKLSQVKITKLPPSFENLKSLKELELQEVEITELPESTVHLHALESLRLIACSRLKKLPSSTYKLLSLISLKVKYCNSLGSLPELPQLLEELEVEYCESLATLQFVESRSLFLELREVSFIGCNKLDTSEIWEYAKDIIRDLRPKDFWYWAKNYIIFAGNEIPKWFGNKNRGSSITIKLPSALTETWKFVFCAVFERSRENKYGECRAGAISAECHIGSDLLYFKTRETARLYCKGVDHVVVWRRKLTDKQKDRLATCLGIEIQFDFKQDLPEKVKVKQCGIQVISNGEALPSHGSVGLKREISAVAMYKRSTKQSNKKKREETN